MRGAMSQCLRQTRSWLSLALVLHCGIMAGASARNPEKPADLTQLSLEDLLNTEVTTASKKEQKLAHTAAAVYVISAEDIERAGVTSVPEALRLAPGVEVAQINSDQWAISIRGFNNQFSNKLLVLIDGRTIYFPTFSGVLWNTEDLGLEDIERIEVIRGPGASVWGANAVNGVINIITKSTKDTHGGLISATAGTHDQALAGLRFGGAAGGIGYRLSLRYAERGPFANSMGSGHDRWNLQRANLRSDWNPSKADTLLFEGDLFQTAARDTIHIPLAEPPYSAAINDPWYYSGGSGLLRWKHVMAGGSEDTLQGFYDRTHAGAAGFLDITNLTFDVDFQQQARLLSRNEVVWGLGIRRVVESTTGSFGLFFIPANLTTKLFSGFGQDEITLVRNHLWLTLGSKLEHNDYTGIEIQPTLRLLWTPNARHSFWISGSRAARTPSSYEDRVRYIAGILPGENNTVNVQQVFGNQSFEAERFLVCELGYRTQLSSRLSLDSTLFYSKYSNVSSELPGQPFLNPSLLPNAIVLPLLSTNEVRGHSEGLELSARYAATSYWTLTGSYSWLRLRDGAFISSPTTIAVLPPGNDPAHQTQFHSYLTILRGVELDGSAYYTGGLVASGVPPYTRVDAHLAWSPLERLKLSAGLQNLLTPRHTEFIDPISYVLFTQVRRSFYGKAVWRF
jgi:iron complex outermembrane receptor protein